MALLTKPLEGGQRYGWVSVAPAYSQLARPIASAACKGMEAGVLYYAR
jgi:hypothetical protein